MRSSIGWSARATPRSPLQVVYLGDARNEKGYQHLPGMAHALWKDFIQPGRVEVTLQSNYNMPGGEGGIPQARLKLQRFPHERRADHRTDGARGLLRRARQGRHRRPALRSPDLRATFVGRAQRGHRGGQSRRRAGGDLARRAARRRTRRRLPPPRWARRRRNRRHRAVPGARARRGGLSAELPQRTEPAPASCRRCCRTGAASSGRPRAPYFT